MKKKIFFLAFNFYFLLCNFSSAQNPLVKMWDKRFGGTDYDEFSSFQQTRDGGYILGGSSESGIGGDKTQASISYVDYWIVKLDAFGNKQWDKDFGGLWAESIRSVQQTSDGGYMLGGFSYSEDGGDKTQPLWGTFGADCDFWIIKIDSLGNKQWDKDFGGTHEDQIAAAIQTTDGGYILGGYSRSGISGDKTQFSWGGLFGDYWILKIDSLGNKQWDKDFGGTNYDNLWALQQTSDGGYILGGTSSSAISGNKTQATKGNDDYWIVKTDSLGNKLWDRDFGGTGSEDFYSLLQTSDGGYIFGGWSSSNISGDKSVANWDTTGNTSDYWVVKTDSLGNKLWDKDFGGMESEPSFGNIYQAIDGGYLISGTSNSSIGGDKTENNLGTAQTWILKTDSLGNKQWDKTIFTSGNDHQAMTIQTTDGCYVIANMTNGEIAGYKTQTAWDSTFDYWIIKFCDSTLTTNIANTEKENEQLLLSPNPTTGELKIKNAELKIEDIEIFNLLGEKMYDVAVDCRLRTVDCRLLPAGIYFVKVVAGEKVLLGKVVKE